MSISSSADFKMELPPVGVVRVGTNTMADRRGSDGNGSTRGGSFYTATSGKPVLATSGKFFMATDTQRNRTQWLLHQRG